MLVLFFSIGGYSNTPKEVVKAATTQTKAQEDSSDKLQGYFQ